VQNVYHNNYLNCTKTFILDWLTLDDGTDRLSRNSNSLPNLCHVKLQHGKDLRSPALQMVKDEYGC